MNKKTSLAASEIDDSEEISTQIIPIRTETVLSQYPLHRLSKGGEPLALCIVKTNERGRVKTNWEVSANPKYGEPGILAYKVDTLVINRIIDQLRPNIPELVRIGTLNEIGDQLGRKRTRNTTPIAEALSQNAGALITAKIEYAGNDGRSRTLELRSTRYGVIFVGEMLPNGQKADAVYIALNPAFREVLRHAKTRPLDYDFLRDLPPASQRLYELISYQIFAALNRGNPRARYLYSDFCKFAPLTRYQDREDVRKQLHKIHAPHLKAGYIKQAELELMIDENGDTDWIIWYTPGPKAKREFKEFNSKKDRQTGSGRLSLPPPRLTLPVPEERAATPRREEGTQNTHDLNPQEMDLIDRLTAVGIDQSRAERLVKADREECEMWVEAWRFQNQKGMDNPPAVLIRFIESKRRPLPKEYTDAKKREESHKRQEEFQNLQRAREVYFHFFEDAFRDFQGTELQRVQQATPKAYALFQEWIDINHSKGLRLVSSERRREEIRIAFAEEFFYSVRPELGIVLTSFKEWDEYHNPAACDPVEHQDRLLMALLAKGVR